MPYSNIISRADAAALIPEEVAAQIIADMPKQSLALQLFRQVRMARGQMRQPVLSALPVAYWVVPTDTGLKQTTELNWTNIMLNVEEIACIVPIPQAVLDDSVFDIWAESRPFIAEAIGRTLDAAVFFGTNKPASWPAGIAPAADLAANYVVAGTATAAQGGAAGDLINAFAKVWEDGYTVNFAVAPPSLQAAFWNLRSTDGQPLNDVQNVGGQTFIAGVPISYGLGGLWPTGTGAYQTITGDRQKAIIGIRQDISFRILDQAVIQNDTGVIQYNLAQQDMVAMRCIFRVAYAVPNPITWEQPNNALRFPFSVLKAA